MTLTIAGIAFDQVHYDPRADVLYVSVAGYEGPPADALSTAEGHNLEFDAAGRAIGMTLTNVRRQLERDGALTLTLPLDEATAAQRETLSQPTASVTAQQLQGGLRSAVS